MSRHIPQVKLWKVVHLVDGQRREVGVYAPNRRFAIWNAEKDLGPFYWTRGEVMCGRVTSERTAKKLGVKNV